MDQILASLQGKAFHLSEVVYGFLSNQYSSLLALPIPDVEAEGFTPGVIRQIIEYHRAQFLTEEYIESRIKNPTTGTIDHIHAEITADLAINLGIESNYSGYAIELLRTAAHYHDSDRSFPRKMILGEEAVRHDLHEYAKYKKKHAANSARIARDMISKASENGYKSPAGFTRDLGYMIVKHEIGGSKEERKNRRRTSAVDSSLDLDDLTDILMTSDSLAYFKANILTNWEECGKNKILLGNKVHFMYDRLNSKGQKKLRKLLFAEGSHILGKPSADDNINNIRTVLLNIIA